MPTKKKPDYAQEALEQRRSGPAKSLSYEQIATVLRLAGDKTQEEIAEFMGVHQSTISRILSEFTDTRLVAKARLTGAAELMAERVITASQVAAARGDASPALEVLDRIDALPKRQTADKGGPKVVVVVGSVQPPAFPTITVEPPLLTSSSVAVD